MGVDQTSDETDIEVEWIPFPLHPETPEEGRDLTDLFSGSGIDVDTMMDKVREVARSVGVPMGNRKRTYNSRLAQELGKWADESGKGREFRDGIYRSYFSDGNNIARAEELISVAGNIGLNAEEAARILEKRSYKGAVDEDWRRARRLGINAVPTHLFSGRRVSGFLSAEQLRGFLDLANEE